MRITILALLLIAISGITGYSQTSVYQTMKNKFSDSEDVFAFSTSGFLAKAALWVAGEHEFTDAIGEIDQIRIITVPKAAFEKQDVTVKGLKKLITKSSYEVLTSIRDHGDEVTLFIQSGKKERNNRYFVLVDSADDVVGIEIQGYIDPEILLRKSELSYESNP
jgi:hypothetical protein